MQHTFASDNWVKFGVLYFTIIPWGRLRKRLYQFSCQQDHSTTVENNVMHLNVERQVINKQEVEVCISSAMIVLNEGE